MWLSILASCVFAVRFARSVIFVLKRDHFCWAFGLVGWMVAGWSRDAWSSIPSATICWVSSLLCSKASGHVHLPLLTYSVLEGARRTETILWSDGIGVGMVVHL